MRSAAAEAKYEHCDPRSAGPPSRRMIWSQSLDPTLLSRANAGILIHAVGQVFVRPGDRPGNQLRAVGPEPRPPGPTRINGSVAITWDQSRNLYPGSVGAGRILRVEAETRQIENLRSSRQGRAWAGINPSTAPPTKSPKGLGFDEAGNQFQTRKVGASVRSEIWN